LCDTAPVNAKHLLWGAVLLGTAAGYVWAGPSGRPEPLNNPGPSGSKPTPEEVEHSAYYPNCRAAWDDGHAPIFRGQPGYRPELDGDSDGIACEPYRG
jgi:hypothetical protein